MEDKISARMTKIGIEKAEERRRGPKRVELSYKLLYDLSSISMSMQQIADYVGVSIKVISSNQDYVDACSEGKASFTKSLLDKQYKIAMDDKHKDQTKLLIHLGKVVLGQRETTVVENNLSTSFDDLITMKDKLK